MMADMVICQSCCRNPGMYQCDYCWQINCPDCTADDPERVACRSPCQTTESRPAKRLRNAPEVAHSASMVAAPELQRELVSEEPQDGSLPVGRRQPDAYNQRPTRKGRTPTGGEQIPLVPLLQEQVVELGGEQLPSEKVGTPDAPGLGLYPLAVAVVLWVAMAVLDMCAWFRTAWDFLVALCGRRPPACDGLPGSPRTPFRAGLGPLPSTRSGGVGRRAA